MNTPYSFSVVRYVHDVVGGEFVNVGVAIYAPEMDYIDLMRTTKYGRLSKLFINVDGAHFLSIMKFLEEKITEKRNRFENELQLETKPKDILEILNRIIAKDDSSIQFSSPGSGLTNDPNNTLKNLYERYVEQYTKEHVKSRNDKKVWKVFRKPLEKKHVIEHLKEHVVEAEDFEYKFDYALKNGQWQVFEPLSFDLKNEKQIEDKAFRCLGTYVSLRKPKEDFKLYLLLGMPKRKPLENAYFKFEKLLRNNIPIQLQCDIFKEHEAEAFADIVKTDLIKHTGNL